MEKASRNNADARTLTCPNELLRLYILKIFMRESKMLMCMITRSNQAWRMTVQDSCGEKLI